MVQHADRPIALVVLLVRDKEGLVVRLLEFADNKVNEDAEHAQHKEAAADEPKKQRERCCGLTLARDGMQRGGGEWRHADSDDDGGDDGRTEIPATLLHAIAEIECRVGRGYMFFDEHQAAHVQLGKQAGGHRFLDNLLSD
eukprot:scaffold16545_cov121-Isochrysis_galbana.AAC.8